MLINSAPFDVVHNLIYRAVHTRSRGRIYASANIKSEAIKKMQEANTTKFCIKDFKSEQRTRISYEILCKKKNAARLCKAGARISFIASDI